MFLAPVSEKFATKLIDFKRYFIMVCFVHGNHYVTVCAWLCSLAVCGKGRTETKDSDVGCLKSTSIQMLKSVYHFLCGICKQVHCRAANFDCFSPKWYHPLAAVGYGEQVWRISAALGRYCIYLFNLNFFFAVYWDVCKLHEELWVAFSTYAFFALTVLHIPQATRNGVEELSTLLYQNCAIQSSHCHTTLVLRDSFCVLLGHSHAIKGSNDHTCILERVDDLGQKLRHVNIESLEYE